MPRNETLAERAEAVRVRNKRQPMRCAIGRAILWFTNPVQLQTRFALEAQADGIKEHLLHGVVDAMIARRTEQFPNGPEHGHSS